MCGGGGVLLYFHTYIGSGHFFGFKILNLTFIIIFFFLGGGVQKKKIGGYEDFVDVFGGHHKIGLYSGVISMYFRALS